MQVTKATYYRVIIILLFFVIRYNINVITVSPQFWSNQGCSGSVGVPNLLINDASPVVSSNSSILNAKQHPPWIFSKINFTHRPKIFVLMLC